MWELRTFQTWCLIEQFVARNVHEILSRHQAENGVRLKRQSSSIPLSVVAAIKAQKMLSWSRLATKLPPYHAGIALISTPDTLLVGTASSSRSIDVHQKYPNGQLDNHMTVRQWSRRRLTLLAGPSQHIGWTIVTVM